MSTNFDRARVASSFSIVSVQWPVTSAGERLISVCFDCSFLAPIIPYGYHAQVIHGFVEELVVNDDPEYQWIDKIRTPRASNEARQVVFLKLSSQVIPSTCTHSVSHDATNWLLFFRHRSNVRSAWRQSIWVRMRSSVTRNALIWKVMLVLWRVALAQPLHWLKFRNRISNRCPKKLHLLKSEFRLILQFLLSI